MKRTFIKIFALVLVAVAAAVILPMFGGSAAVSEGQSDNHGTGTESAIYTVGQWDGKVALFTKDFESGPAFETDIDIRNLREYDRRLLATGISVSTYEEVLHLIEDFGP